MLKKDNELFLLKKQALSYQTYIKWIIILSKELWQKSSFKSDKTIRIKYTMPMRTITCNNSFYVITSSCGVLSSRWAVPRLSPACRWIICSYSFGIFFLFHFSFFYALFWQQIEKNTRGFGLLGRNRACCMKANN